MKRRGTMIWQIWILALILVIALAMAGFLWLRHDLLQLELIGGETVTLEYGAVWQDPGVNTGFAAEFLVPPGTQITLHTEGQERLGELGSYRVTYRANAALHTIFGDIPLEAVQERTVRIVDTTPPVITLTGDPEKLTLPGCPYEEEGFQAVDLHDGELTAKVERTEENGQVRYRVSDGAGNTAEVLRPIRYGDNTPPVLTLVGEGKISVLSGEAYQDPGFTGWDNFDGDISDRVLIEGLPDMETPGEYVLTYLLSDSHGNTVSAQRTVEVLDKWRLLAQKNLEANTGKVVYLTFDDGPSEHTPVILDILAKYGVKATFFVMCTEYPEMLTREAEEGHTVAMHCFSHNYNKIYASEDAYFSDLAIIRQRIYNYTGQRARYVRFPGGSSNTVSRFNPGIMTRLTSAVTEKGFRYFDWNVDSNDAGGAASSDEIFENVTKGIAKRKVSVVLMHDSKYLTARALERIIQWCIENGYVLKAIDDGAPGCHHGTQN